MNTIKVIGCGGIFTQMMIPFMQYVHKKGDYKVTLIDGDEFEGKNSERQIFHMMRNKALASMCYLQGINDKFVLDYVEQYLSEDNVELIEEGDIVMLCVDNHKTRKLVEDRTEELKDVTVISGGNELIDGNVMVIKKVKGKYLTKKFSELHTEIAEPKDKSPHEMSCLELAEAGTPQIVITNMNAGCIMLNELFNIFEKQMCHNEIFFDILQNKSRSTKEVTRWKN